MKDQLKKTFSDASRNIPTKTEEVIKTEDTFLTEDINNMTLQEDVSIDQEYNPFRMNSQQTAYDQEQDIFYNRGNYRNYNRRNNNNRQYQQQTRTRPSQNLQRQIHLPNRRKNPCDRNGTQLKCHICESIYHMAQNCPGKFDTLYTQEVILYQSDFDHPEQLKH